MNERLTRWTWFSLYVKILGRGKIMALLVATNLLKQKEMG
jgi:hypothetical protein